MNTLRRTFLGWYIKSANLNKSVGSKFCFIRKTRVIGNRLNTFGYFTQKTVAAFATSTIVLGVINSDLRNDLEEKESSTTTTTTTVTPTSITTTEKPIDMAKYRLPKNVIPKSYDLYLYPDLKTGLFKGKVIAGVKILENTESIVLNSNKLLITRVSIDNIDVKYSLDEKFEQLSIFNANNAVFPAGEINVLIEFNGDMNNRIVGLYRSSYANSKGERRYMATSKFEPTYARQAFPCFDEPNFKATYRVHLLKPDEPNYIALSNNPEISEEKVEGGVMVHFSETVPMSTYLSCFIVSDFKNVETTFNNGGNNIPFRVFASPEQLEKTSYAAEVGKKTIEYYVTYFNIPYPLPKLDMVAIPDFVSGAMEHWGLVTYRETALLYTPETHSSSNKQRVATVVAHELAHSWFGNLVTMDWWDNLWLNEGFASYIEYKGVLAAEPTWGMLDQFLTAELHPVLSLDSTQGSHPIIQTVITPDQITEVFDTISYNKGASVLRMLEDVVGENNFQLGVTNYLKKYKYGNAVTVNLWDEIQNVVKDKLNVTEFMDTFTVQMGFPILTISKDNNKYIFKQKRFLIDPASASNSKPSPYNYKWSVPITYITDVNSAKSNIVWFDHKAENVIIEKPENAQWIKFNPGQIGYYRVNYPEDDWRNLMKIIKGLSVSDRTHLLEESFSIAESGELSYNIPLDFTKYLTEEFDYVPWSVAAAKLQMISDHLENSEHIGSFKKYVITLLEPVYKKLTWKTKPDDTHLDKLARVTVLSLACNLEYDDALNQAKTIFDKFIKDSEPVDQDLRSIVYKYGMYSADVETWGKLWTLFTKETDANEKLKLMNGLASVRNTQLLHRLIELAKDETYVRSQDYFTLLQYISANPLGTPIIWDYVRENWMMLVERFTLNDRYLGSLIPAITKRFRTGIKLEEMKHFFSLYPDAGAGVANRGRALENVSNNIKWLTNYKSIVEKWIKENSK